MMHAMITSMNIVKSYWLGYHFHGFYCIKAVKTEKKSVINGGTIFNTIYI